MKNLGVQSVVAKYCSIAKMKETLYSNGRQIAATHIFGAQQFAVLYWSESGKSFDIKKVISMLAMHNITCVSLPTIMTLLIKEFELNRTFEARFAHFCLDVESELQTIGNKPYAEEIRLIKGKHYNLLYEANVSDEQFDQLCAAMTKWVNTTDMTPVSSKLIKHFDTIYPEFLIEIEDLNRVMVRYFILAELKYKVRMGWNYWNVNTPHREVVSEHSFGTQPLACLMYHYGENQLDYNKVIFMMALHETEESIMPDFTPYDPVTQAQMLAMGKKSVQVLFGGLRRGKELSALLDEFNAHDTVESRFAYFCDKLECLFRIKRYTDLGLCSIEGGQDIVKNDPKVKQNLANGAKTVADFFIMNEMPKYTSHELGKDFVQVSNFLRDYDASK